MPGRAESVKTGLRGHDGALLSIAYGHAMVYAAARGQLTLGVFERQPVLLWTPPAPPAPKKTTLFQRLVMLCGLTRGG